MTHPRDAILDRPAPLSHLELREVRVPQVEPFRSAVGVRTERRALIVRWFDDEGGWGVGECSCRPDPFFSGEFVDGAWSVLADHLAPLLSSQGTVRDVVRACDRVRGWPFTVAAVLDALFDAQRRGGAPDPLDLWPGDRLDRVPVGISLGLFKEPSGAVERVGRELDAGYRRIKMKLSPAADVEVYRAVRDAHPDAALAFDANGSLHDDHFDLLAHLDELQPVAVEQPFAPDRLDHCVRLRQQLPDLELCLDESVASPGQLETAHAREALDELNLKPGRVGGPLAAVRCMEFCRDHGLATWVGGMFETGIGRVANLRYAARMPGALAHDLSPSSRYFLRDLVTQPVHMDDEGLVAVDDRPVELDLAAFDELTLRRAEIRPGG